MIINTGQRTDIPAFYAKWFMNRIKEGYVLVRNPYFTSYIVKKICNINGIKFKEVYNDFEIKAYENYKTLINQK